jgi:hypothetical protein
MEVKQLIEALQKLEPTSQVWVSWATKSELEDYFVAGCEINDTDWQDFINSFSGDWEYVSECLDDIMKDNNEKNVYCEQCNLYDYDCITDEDNQETYCRVCGEEDDVLND